MQQCPIKPETCELNAPAADLPAPSAAAHALTGTDGADPIGKDKYKALEAEAKETTPWPTGQEPRCPPYYLLLVTALMKPPDPYIGCRHRLAPVPPLRGGVGLHRVQPTLDTHLLDGVVLDACLVAPGWSRRAGARHGTLVEAHVAIRRLPRTLHPGV
jgi:hypothetical protein